MNIVMEEKEIIKEESTEINEETVPAEVEPSEETEQESTIEQEIDTVVLIEKPNKDTRPYSEVVEEERRIIMKQQKKSSRISMISIVLVLALSITGVFLINVVPIVSYVLMGVAIVALIAFSIIIKRYLRPDVHGYILRGSKAINEFCFADGRFKEVKCYTNDKLELADVANDGAYANVSRVASRNIIDGLYEDRGFKVCEAAFFQPAEKNKEKTVFLGKYLTAVNSLHFEGRFVIVSKGDEDTDIPDDLEGLVQLEVDGKFYIYGPDEKSLSLLDKKFIKALKNINIKSHLLNLTLVIWAGKTIVYLSYDDETITLPFQKPYEADTAVQYRDNLIEVLDALGMINK